MKTILLAGFLIFGQAFAGEATLQSVETSGGGDTDFLTDLSFDKEVVSQGLIEFAKDYIQVDLKGPNQVSRREVVRVSNPVFQSVILSQFSPDIVRARLMLKEPGQAEKFKGRVAVESTGNRVRVRVMSAGSEIVAEPEVAAEADVVPEAISAGTLLEKPATELLAGELNKPVVSEPASPEANRAKTESEIPVLTKATAQFTKSDSTTTRLVISLGVVLLVAGGIVMFSRQWAKRRTGLAQHHQIKVLTQYGLGPKKSLAIIRVAGESILIGVTDTNISMIKSLALLDEDLPIEVPKDFSHELGHNMIPIPEKMSLPAPAPTQVLATKDQEDFSFGTVRDMVASRLREMRSL